MSGKRILVVDDDASLVTLVVEVLGDEGLPARAVTSVREATSAIQQAAPDLVLLDVNLPGLDGRDLLREWRRLPAPTMRILLMSGDRQAMNTLDDAAALGVVGYLFKPFELQELIGKVRQALEGPG